MPAIFPGHYFAWSKREVEVLRLAIGPSNKAIANTVKLSIEG